MFISYALAAIRNVLRHKGYTAINIAGLSVGMAFAVLIMIWVQREVSYDRFHDNLDRLHQVAITTGDGSFYGSITAGALAPHLKETYPEITHAARFSPNPGMPFILKGESYTCRGAFTDPDFLTMFSFPMVNGDEATALDQPLNLVITEGMARKVFGDDDPVGQSLSLGGQADLTVAAVMKDLPDRTAFDFEFLISCAIQPPAFSKWDVKSLQTYVMLAPGSNASLVSEKIRDVFNERKLQVTPNDHFLRPVGDMHLYALGGGGLIIYIVIFSTLAVAVLLIACINFANLATARSVARSREIGVRKTLGAGRTQLVLQFLTESMLVSFVSSLLAICMVELLLPAVSLVAGVTLDLTYTLIDISYLTALMLLTGIVAGGYPAFVLSSMRPAVVLKSGLVPHPGSRLASGSKLGVAVRGWSLRKTLVVAQFAVSIVLIIGVMVIFGQLKYLQSMDVGFTKDNILLFDLPAQAARQSAALKDELQAYPDVEGAAVSQNSLVRWQSSFGIWWEGKETDEMFDVGFNQVDYDYLTTFKMKMAAGRFFSREFVSDAEQAIVINEACRRKMGVTDPVGRKITVAPGSSIEFSGTIIGVIEDYHTESAHKEIRPFMLGLSEYGRTLCVEVAPDNIGGTIDFISGRISGMAPDARISYRFFDAEMRQLYRVEQLTGAVVVYVAAVAAFISCLGLFGLAAYTAQQRTKEIGIRKVLGASTAGIVRLLSSEFLLLVVLGGVIACPLAWYAMNRWLESFAHRMTLGPWVFLIAGFAALLAALATVSVQAIRAASANPIDSFRSE